MISGLLRLNLPLVALPLRFSQIYRVTHVPARLKPQITSEIKPETDEISDNVKAEVS